MDMRFNKSWEKQASHEIDFLHTFTLEPGRTGIVANIDNLLILHAHRLCTWLLLVHRVDKAVGQYEAIWLGCDR